MGSLRSRLTVTAQPWRPEQVGDSELKLETGGNLSTIRVTQAGIFNLKAQAFKLCALPPRLGYSEA